MQEALKKAIKLLGSQAKLAEAINDVLKKEGRRTNIQQQHVQYWHRSGKVKAEYVLAIEKATGGRVLRHQLRPDIYYLEDALIVIKASLFHQKFPYRKHKK